jgi:hypothetical protein
MVAEKCRPCSWEWFVSHGRLERSNKQVERPAILKQAPDQLLSFKDSDVSSAEQWTPFQLRIPPSAWEGQPWVDVVEDGAELYAHVEHFKGYSIITYWTLFAHNKATVFGENDGTL